MDIRTLLEVTAYRIQGSWVNNDEPTIRMTGREARRAHSGAAEAYALAYGMESIGIDCPARWRSTFATTAPNQSYFMSHMGSEGIRKIRRLSSGPVGAVYDDFNAGMIVFGAASNNGGRVEDMLDYLVTAINAGEFGERQQHQHILDLANEGYQDWGYVCYSSSTNDHGYEKFRRAVARIDRVMELAAPLSDAFTKYTNRNKNVTAWIVEDIRRMMDRKLIAVFPSLEETPQENLEVWFEGDYEAIKLTQEEIDALGLNDPV